MGPSHPSTASLAPSSYPSAGGAPSALVDARLTDIAHRIIQGQSYATIAQAHNVSSRQLRRILRDPRLWVIYQDIRDKIWSDLDSLIKDEKSATALRELAIRTRTLTLLGELVEEGRAHIESNRLKCGEPGTTGATALRALAEIVKVALGSGTAEPGLRGPTQAVQVNVNVPQGAAESFRSTVEEAEVDLSDLLEASLEAEEPPAR